MAAAGALVAEVAEAEPARDRPRRAGYRPEVDGLRAVAVVAVVLFHLDVPAFRGGFVGVDVFFVISGYLITRLVLGDMHAGCFSIVTFYERRVRRILPALYAAVALTVAIGAVLFIPSDFAQLGRAAVATALSVSNVLFYVVSGYFGAIALQQPLLHTWSLAVEEQFYFLFPPFLLLCRRLRLSVWPCIGAVIVVSFAIGVWLVETDPTAAFYLPFGRFWEIGLGALLASAVALPVVRWLREAAAAIGLLVLALPVFLYDSTTAFPAQGALLPCVGTALVILATDGAGTTVGRLLSLRPVVFVGLVSYSLYLVHWPAIVFTRMVLARDLRAWESALLVAATFGVSVASWRLVERPFRAGRGVSRRSVFRLAAVGAVVLVLVGAVAWRAHGLSARLPDRVVRLAAASRDGNPRQTQCDGPSPAEIREGRLCVVGAPGVEPTVAVVGDSFGHAVMPGVDAAARDAGKSALVLTRGGCRPLIGNQANTDSCDAFLRAVSDKIAASPTITTVLMIGRWSTMVEGISVGFGPQSRTFLADDLTEARSVEENGHAFERMMTKTVGSFGAKRVFVVSYLPEQRVLVPQAIAMRARLGLDPPAGVTRAEYDLRHRRVRQAFDHLVPATGITVLDAGPYVCDAVQCPLTAGRVVLYRDDNHLTGSAAVRAKALFAPAFT